MKSTFSSADYINAFKIHRRTASPVLGCWTSRIVDQIPRPIPNPLIVDACCGWGRFSFPLSLSTSGMAQVVGVDSSPEMIEICTKMLAETNISNLSFVLEDFTRFQPKRKASLIYISEALQLFKEIETPLAHAIAILDEDASLVIRTTSHSQLNQIEWLRAFPRLLDKDIERTPDACFIVATLRALGYQIVDTFEVNESVEYASFEEYAAPLVSKAYSILQALSPHEIANQLERAQLNTHRGRYFHTFYTTGIIAKPPTRNHNL